MISKIIDLFVMSAGYDPPPQPRSVSEAQLRFFFRLVWVAIGGVVAAVALLVALTSSQSVVRGVAILLALLGGINVFFGVPRLVTLYRAARSISRSAPSNER